MYTSMAHMECLRLCLLANKLLYLEIYGGDLKSSSLSRHVVPTEVQQLESRFYAGAGTNRLQYLRNSIMKDTHHKGLEKKII